MLNFFNGLDDDDNEGVRINFFLPLGTNDKILGQSKRGNLNFIYLFLALYIYFFEIFFLFFCFTVSF